MSDPSPPHDRVRELLAERALFGLSAEEMGELHTLTAGRFDEFDELELSAAALDLAFHSQQGHAPMPEDLRRRTLAAVQRAGTEPRRDPLVAVTPPAATSGVATPSSLEAERASAGGGIGGRELLAWFTTAAALLVAAFLFSRQPTAEEPTPIVLRNALATSENVTRVGWTAGPHPAGEGVEGEVLWSDERQQGVMQFRGLKANDPREYQYQLWIFDAARDEKYPVDGGVFDIPAGQDEVIVRIDPRVPVSKATLFAITMEKPGGTVVSDRSRLPLLAQVPADEAPAENTPDTDQADEEASADSE